MKGRPRCNDEVSQGYLQSCLLMGPARATTADTRKASILSMQPGGQTFAKFVGALQSEFYDLATLRDQYTEAHGEKAERLLLQLQAVVSEQLALLEHQVDQQALIDRLRRLARACQDTLVTVQGVCGLAATGLLLYDPMKTYWHFGNGLRKLQRSCEEIACLAQTEIRIIVAKNVAFHNATFMELPAGLHGRQQFA